jgi:hypothetical protein
MSWDHEYDLGYLDEIDKNYEKFCAYSQMILHYQPTIEQVDEAIEQSKLGVNGDALSTIIRSFTVPLVEEQVALPEPPNTLLYDEASVDSQV